MAKIQSMKYLTNGSNSLIFSAQLSGYTSQQHCIKFIPHNIPQEKNLFLKDELEEQQQQQQMLQDKQNGGCNKFCKMLNIEYLVTKRISDFSYLNAPKYISKCVPNFINNLKERGVETGCLIVTELAQNIYQSPNKQKMVQIHDLHNLACVHNFSDYQLIRNIFSQVLQGLNHLHLNNVQHNDIKLENILVFDMDLENKQVSVKISDFGLASLSQRTTQEQKAAYKDREQSYFSPEMMQMIKNELIKQEQSSINSIDDEMYLQDDEILAGFDEKKCDIFALGVIMFELYSGGIILNQRKQDNFQSKSYQYFVNQDYNNFYRCFNRNHRMNTHRNEIKYSNEQNGMFYNLIYMMVHPDPSFRISAEQALQHPFFNEEKF